jgi:hypothetical protein
LKIPTIAVPSGIRGLHQCVSLWKTNCGKHNCSRLSNKFQDKFAQTNYSFDTHHLMILKGKKKIKSITRSS